MSTYSFVKDLEKLRISEEDIPTSKSLPKNYRGISRVDPPYITKNPITMDYSVKTPELHDIVGHNAAKKKTTTQISRFAEHIPSVILPEKQRIDVNPTQEVHENLVRRYQYDQRQVNRAKRDGLTIGGKKTKKSKKKKNTRSKKHKTHKRKIRKYKKRSVKKAKHNQSKTGGTRSPQEILNQIREGRQQIANAHQHVLQEEDSLASNSWASPDTSINSSFESTYSTNSDDGETTREDISFEEEEPADDDDPLNQGFVLEEGETL
mgnify:CR=1 FL=1